MSPYEERDAQTAAMIRKEISGMLRKVQSYGWHPGSTAWHRAFGEISGMHKILSLIDRDPGENPASEILVSDMMDPQS